MSLGNVNIEDVPDDVDIFDEIVMIEKSSVEKGFNEGHQHGCETGQHDGYKMGYAMGSHIGVEIGFFNGFVSTWLILLKDNPEVKPRIGSLLESLLNLLKNFPVENSKYDNLTTDLRKIQAKFKKVISLMTIGVKTGTSEVKEDLSF